MSLDEYIGETLRVLGLGTSLIVGGLYGINYLNNQQFSTRISKLDNSSYIIKTCNSINTNCFYGYDENKDGKIDRIESTEFGIMPFPRGMATWTINRSLKKEDSRFEDYLDKLNTLKELGKRRLKIKNKNDTYRNL